MCAGLKNTFEGKTRSKSARADHTPQQRCQRKTKAAVRIIQKRFSHLFTSNHFFEFPFYPLCSDICHFLLHFAFWT